MRMGEVSELQEASRKYWQKIGELSRTMALMVQFGRNNPRIKAAMDNAELAIAAELALVRQDYAEFRAEYLERHPEHKLNRQSKSKTKK